MLTQNNAVWVADSGCAVLEGPAADVKVFSQYLPLVPSDRYPCAKETHFSHFHAHRLPVILNMTCDNSTKGFDAESGFLNQALVPKIARKDAETVSTLFRFPAIRVKYSKTEVTYAAVKKATKIAGVSKQISTHVFRHSFAPIYLWKKAFKPIFYTPHRWYRTRYHKEVFLFRRLPVGIHFLKNPYEYHDR